MNETPITLTLAVIVKRAIGAAGFSNWLGFVAASAA